MNPILIVEDEAVIRSALKRLLERNDYQVDEANSVDEAMARIDVSNFSLIIADLRLPGLPGTKIIERCPEIPVLIMTSYASVASAVESMKKGAIDYIAKPFDHQEMLMVVKRILKQVRLERQNAALLSDLQREYPVSGMIGKCRLMRQVFERINKVAPTDATILIRGESGTGKELVARAIHEKSNRREFPFVAVNCAAIPENLLESELFGHERGAFTGAVDARVGLVESADGGTLFLDEIAELSPPAQARILRFLQDGEVRRVGSDKIRHVDVRLLAATHHDLELGVKQEIFRSDLFFRLKVIEVLLPPLRDRGDDIDILVDYRFDKTCKQLNRVVNGFSEKARKLMRAYAWPGNVRELENTIERAVILSDGGLIEPELLALEDGKQTMSTGDGNGEIKTSLEDYMKSFVREHEGYLTETEIARRLGISRKTLCEKRQRFGIPRSKNMLSTER